jgi:hypothetical protein
MGATGVGDVVRGRGSDGGSRRRGARSGRGHVGSRVGWAQWTGGVGRSG